MEDNVPDVHEIIPGLFLGNRRAASSKELLDELHIKLIINFAKEVSIPNNGVNILNIPLNDIPQQDLLSIEEKVSSIIDVELQKGNVLLNCYAGISRSASMLILYLMRKKGVGPDEAIAYVRKIRPIVNPNSGFLRQIYQRR